MEIFFGFICIDVDKRVVILGYVVIFFFDVICVVLVNFIFDEVFGIKEMVLFLVD